MTREEWLAGLKVGDKVAFQYGVCRVWSVRHVTAITNTQIVVGDDRFRRRDGLSIRKDYDRRRDLIVPPTDEIREDVRRRRVLSYINGVRWDEIGTDVLYQVADLLRPQPKEQAQ